MNRIQLGTKPAPRISTLAPGDRVSIIRQTHPYAGHSGVLIAFEGYGLGWTGWRMKLDGNDGETYVASTDVIRTKCKRELLEEYE